MQTSCNMVFRAMSFNIGAPLTILLFASPAFAGNYDLQQAPASWNLPQTNVQIQNNNNQPAAQYNNIAPYNDINKQNYRANTTQLLQNNNVAPPIQDMAPSAAYIATKNAINQNLQIKENLAAPQDGPNPFAGNYAIKPAPASWNVPQIPQIQNYYTNQPAQNNINTNFNNISNNLDQANQTNPSQNSQHNPTQCNGNKKRFWLWRIFDGESKICANH